MENKIDTIAIRNFLTIRYNPKQKSEFSPASINDFSNGNSDPDGSKTETLLMNSFKSNFSNDDKPISISLSGGIDSTLALGLLRKTFPKRKLIGICGVFEGAFNESNIAEEITEKFEADFKLVKMDSIFTSMSKIISITQKPKWNTYIHLIAKNAKKFSDNFVTGDGADEIFGGYTFRYSKFLNSLKPNDNWLSKTKNYLECHNRDWVPDQEKMFGSNINFDWDEIYVLFKKYFDNKLKPLEQVMLADFNGKLLYDFIPLGRTISNYYNLKSFSPFLNKDVISFGLKLPLFEKYDFKTTKGKLILRKISKRLGINHIDDKRGFSPSILTDWQKNGKNICDSYIVKKDSYIFQQKLINRDWVLEALEKIENDGDIRYLNRIISILALEIWYRLFVLKK